MSSKSQIRTQAATEAEIRKQLDDVFEPWTKSVQAKGDANLQGHDDGEVIHKEFGIPPLHRWMHQSAEAGKFVAQYPKAFIGAIVHVTEREMELLEQIQDDVEYRPGPHHRPDHPVLRDQYPALRGRMLEWILDHPQGLQMLTVGGTDVHAHGAPGSGKTTLGLSLAMWRMQVNNETILWADTLDDTGTNERTEWLPLAGWTTLALPKGLDVQVRIVPKNPSVDPFEVDVSDICRDVIRYTSPRDLNRRLMPGQFYVVYPDPRFQGCGDVSRHSFHAPGDVTPFGEEGPDRSTPANHWWFAYAAARISHDDFVHHTTLSMDEAGNFLDPDARKDDHDSYEKVTWFAEKFADARKKGMSVDMFTHALSELHPTYRKKQRWWVTMNGTRTPAGKELPGEKKCPAENDWSSDMDPGEGLAWTTNGQNFAPVSWPNLKRKKRLDAQVSIDFPGLGGGA